MITFILCVVVGIVWAIIEEYKEGWNTEFIDYILKGVLGLIGGLAVGFILMFILPSQHTIEETTTELVSINDGRGINGKMYFLGSGTIKDEMKFSYYTSENGYFKLNNVSADKSKIKYTEEKNLVRTFKVVPTKIWYNYLSFSTKWGNKEYIFEIPKGSIVESFTLDAQ